MSMLRSKYGRCLMILFYNGGFDLKIDEQDDFIDVLKGVPSFVNFNNVGEPYTS